jgi:hypothetical protein
VNTLRPPSLPKTQTLPMPRDSCCAEACKTLFFKFLNSLSGLHSEKVLRNVANARKSCLSGNHAWLSVNENSKPGTALWSEHC